MTNEEFVRHVYKVAEVKDIPGWLNLFTPDGVFIDNSVAVSYHAPDDVRFPVENYGTAFSDMHRELNDMYVSGDVVIVQLALQGTHDGPSQHGASIRLPVGGMIPRGSCSGPSWVPSSANCTTTTSPIAYMS